MSSKHTRYVRLIDATRGTNGGGLAVFAGGGGPAVPASGQVMASDVIFAPAGNIQATRVQGALEELDAEKLGLDGGTMTGLLILSGVPVDDLGAATKWYVDNLPALTVPDAAGVPVARLLGDFVPAATRTNLDHGRGREVAGCVCGGADRAFYHVRGGADRGRSRYDGRGALHCRAYPHQHDCGGCR